MTILAMRAVAARINFLTEQIAELDPQLALLVHAHPAGPTLLDEPGVGPVVAAQLLVRAGRTPVECAAKPPLPPSPASARSRPAAGNELATASTAPATAPSIGPCTPWP
jgi:hypothetical protein